MKTKIVDEDKEVYHGKKTEMENKKVFFFFKWKKKTEFQMHLLGLPVGEGKVNEDEEIFKEKWWSHFQSRHNDINLFSYLLHAKHSY